MDLTLRQRCGRKELTMVKTIIFIVLFILSCIKSIIEYAEDWTIDLSIDCFIDLIKIFIPKCIIWGILYLIIF